MLISDLCTDDPATCVEQRPSSTVSAASPTPPRSCSILHLCTDLAGSGSPAMEAMPVNLDMQYPVFGLTCENERIYGGVDSVNSFSYRNYHGSIQQAETQSLQANQYQQKKKGTAGCQPALAPAKPHPRVSKTYPKPPSPQELWMQKSTLTTSPLPATNMTMAGICPLPVTAPPTPPTPSTPFAQPATLCVQEKRVPSSKDSRVSRAKVTAGDAKKDPPLVIEISDSEDPPTRSAAASTSRSSRTRTDQQASSQRSAQDSARQKKRPASPGSPDEVDEVRETKKRRMCNTTLPTTEGRDYACPFFKRNRAMYWSHRLCRTSGWPSVHRVKEHLYRHHLHHICDRCTRKFPSQEICSEHKREEIACDLSAQAVTEDMGFDREMEKRLRSRKNIKGLNETSKWCQMFRLLFPSYNNKVIPSPFVDYNEMSGLLFFPSPRVPSQPANRSGQAESVSDGENDRDRVTRSSSDHGNGIYTAPLSPSRSISEGPGSYESPREGAPSTEDREGGRSRSLSTPVSEAGRVAPGLGIQNADELLVLFRQMIREEVGSAVSAEVERRSHSP